MLLKPPSPLSWVLRKSKADSSAREHTSQGLLQGVEGCLSGASTQGTCQNKAYGHEPEKNEL